MIQTRNRKTPKIFSLVHLNKPPETQTKPVSPRNIFDNISQSSNYFQTCPSENIFPLTVKQSKVKVPCSHMESLGFLKKKIKVVKTERNEKMREEIYKKNFPYFIAQQKNNKTKTSMPILDIKDSNLPKKAQSHKKTNSDINSARRWTEKINKFLLKRSIVEEIVYNQDLSTRFGHQYFEKIVRNRYQDQKEIIPFTYSIKQNINLPTQDKFSKFIKEIHPSIISRNSMKLKGNNRVRALTEEKL